MDNAPSTRQLVALVTLVVAVLATLCVLYALTPATGRVGLWDKLTVAGPGAGAGLVATVVAWLGIRRVSAAQTEHTEQLQQITHQTNGVLTQRMEEIVARQLDVRGLDSVTDWWHRNEQQIDALQEAVDNLAPHKRTKET